ncbi:MAG: hypothetical protein IPK23_08450 [Rhizobiales bacterium]|jgi:hypothetical protein|nr:hypothetical protein [Hyphomicrobiales bacterium]
MGLLVRFPLERARAVPPVANNSGGASILVLPVIRIERSVKKASHETQSKPRAKSGGRPRRRAKRPA